VDSLCRIFSDLRPIPLNNFKRKWKGFKSYYVAEYDIIFTAKSTGITFELQFQGKKFGTGTKHFNVQYNELET
jgi:hypothetical protein